MNSRGIPLALPSGEMPSNLHQGIVGVFRDDPDLAFDLLRSVFGIELPALEDIYDRKSELDRYAPCFGDTGELRPDLALSAKLVVPEHRRSGAAMIIEVQKKVDSRKRWRIWVYWALLAELLKLSTVVMVIPMSDAVSRWARSLGALEIPAREGLLVLDRHNMPRITELDVARRRPSKAVLSALIHRDLELLWVALTVALELADDRRWRYASSLLSAAPESEREILLEGLTMEDRYELTEVELNSIAYHDGLRAGKREGKLEGKREGKLEGKLEGLVDLVLTVLELREISVDEHAQARIRACRDPELLERWVARAKRVDDLTAVFEADPPQLA